MKFIIKLSPEITIKSQSVRLRFIKILASSIRNILRLLDPGVTVMRYWDRIEVRGKDPARQAALCEALTRIPGIHHVLLVEEHTFKTLHDIFQLVLAANEQRLQNKTFCVRVKRKGEHEFNSLDVERYVGGGLNQHIATAKVKLTAPDEQISLQIEQDQVLLVKERIEGMNGFPIGTQEDVLSLISGGFDSFVASYLLMRRGCRVHYCFFTLGGPAHEIGVKQMAYYLWQRFGSSHRVRFIAIDFAPVVGEILEKIDDGQMGVILKRMMMRAASQVAQRYGIQALVTGEALGQVSSQTLTNLRQIDRVTDTLILRPLISEDKEKIIALARQLGTEDLASTMPEFCGVISKKPTVKAVEEKILAEEAKFDLALLEQVVQQAERLDIRDIAERAQQQISEVETLADLQEGEIILDIRAPEDQEDNPLLVAGVSVIPLPFYKLQSQFAALDQDKTYLLYCRRGVMSRMQALYLQEMGFNNIKIYHPEQVK